MATSALAFDSYSALEDEANDARIRAAASVSGLLKRGCAMKKVTAIPSMLFLILLAGCSTMPVVQMSTAAIPPDDAVKFVDQRSSPSVGPAMFTTSNIYSCHYGIKQIDNKAMHPDRMELLHAYLDNRIFTGGQPRTVTVKRFDIYWNRHLAMEARGPFFGGIGEAISASGYVIGCKGAQEGEYYKAEVPGPNYSAIVIYLDSVISGQTYDVRTVYPILENSGTKSEWPKALTGAIQETFTALGNLVARGGGATN